ncbi:MAG TPA: S9 family peptidase, partial [Vicinamibacteria bacterium]
MKSGTLVVLVLSAAASFALAESVPYRMPPKAIADIADAAPTPQVLLDPSGEWLLSLEHPALASMEDLSREELRLAGIRFNPGTNSRSRRNVAVRAEILRVADGTSRAIQGLPESPRIDHVSFSPNGSHFAFTQTTNDGMELWVADVATATAKRIASKLNGVFEDIYHWRSDGRGLVARTVPANRGPAPKAPSVPEGPIVQETSGENAAAWTYQDLL